ncbi:MAG: acetyl-CoA carboxylase biotin carboxylase subunit [Eubacterium sp.]
MLKKVLIANRGEIALRVIRECMDNGIQTVIVYSEADKDSLPVMMADQAVCIGPASPSESYLNQARIITAAKLTGCDAVHPGFGFLSENPEFARQCEENGLKFIGPSSKVISEMGDKAKAKEMMKKAGVPVVPGSDGPVSSIEEAEEIAEKVGFPVLIKASAGGGGRGMRRADSAEEFTDAYRAASMEAEAAFGNGTVYIEKLIVNPRHVEVQILADQYGNVIHLGERNCSIQRRNQKMLEEAPCFGLSGETRRKLCQAAVTAAKASGYESAGTVEFVMDDQEQFYFIEMNTRIQVEHPVTEMITGVNIVLQQLRIASGAPLNLRQEDIHFKGHAIECRICAEDAANGFSPAPGNIDFIHFPGGCGVRVESALFSGSTISPWYDSLAAKIIVHADTRVQAVRRMRRSLAETIIRGIPTTLDIQQLILYNRKFLRGNYTTGFAEEELPAMIRTLRTAGTIADIEGQKETGQEENSAGPAHTS